MSNVIGVLRAEIHRLAQREIQAQVAESRKAAAEFGGRSRS